MRRLSKLRRAGGGVPSASRRRTSRSTTQKDICQSYIAKDDKQMLCAKNDKQMLDDDALHLVDLS
jgi:hypothetical protein